MWVKICGIRDIETAREIACLRPDAIGLNFFARSPRVVSVAAARQIVAALPPEVEPVGLFVNHSLDELSAICREAGLRTVQIHGDEPPEFLAALADRLPDLKILRAVRLGSDGIRPVTELLEACRANGVEPAAILIDACVEGFYGGSGQVAPWELLRDADRHGQWPKLILAGGLDPGNVTAAIRTVRPWGVDVAGGVESSAACKDLARVAAFIEAARASEDAGAHP